MNKRTGPLAAIVRHYALRRPGISIQTLLGEHDWVLVRADDHDGRFAARAYAFSAETGRDPATARLVRGVFGRDEADWTKRTAGGEGDEDERDTRREMTHETG